MPIAPEPPEWVLAHRRRVGMRIRDLRIDAELSQECLAQRAGLDRKTIYRIELATYSTSIDHLAMVAAALGVSIAFLFADS